MKINLIKITKLLFASLLFLSVYSCKDAELEVLDIGEGFLQVARTAENISEGNAAGTKVRFLFGGTSNENGITVKYTVTSEDDSRFTESNGGTVEIPAESFEAEITIVPINNLATDGNLDVVITLSTDNDFPVGIAGGINNVSKVVSIIDDDCPISINDWVGTYAVDENFTDGPNAPRGLSDFFNEQYQFELALDPNDTSGTKLIITNSTGFNTYMANGTVLSFDTCNNNVAFDDSNTVFIALFENFTFTESSYDEEKFTIKCEGSYRGEYQFTLTKI
ncbi:hypothetical protein [uncultured Polaribacter sp.]|uniref:hypothetical protein n=1 Tax=uncultured Polaribacter sp. TaxID=174711 RepID=UPI00260AA9AA|nr:hypothetical protein [uncultured Polaribacter sp.]